MSVSDLISMHGDLPPSEINIILPVDHPFWRRALELPEVASMARPSASCAARLLLIRGLELIAQGEALPLMCSGRARTIACAGWVDQWCYELANERRVSMRSLAQGAVILALESLVDQA
jgi:hypothetical protein